jgi:hypothetical protein
MEGLYWEYKGIIEFMKKYPATYGMDSRREKVHLEILSKFPESSREKVTEILHNIKSDMIYWDFMKQVEQLKIN